MSEHKHISAKLRSRYEVADGLAIFEFDPSQPMTWEAGQYATIGIRDGNGALIERPYTICSSPSQGFLEFLIELVPEGTLTPLLWKLKPDDTVEVREKTEGQFALDTNSGRTTHLMVASITGIAPYLSMLRRYRADLLSGKTSDIHHFVIVHAGSRTRGMAYEDEFRMLSLDVQLLQYDGSSSGAEHVIRTFIDNARVPLTEITAYLCGHSEMTQAGLAALRQVGMPEDNLRIEQYYKS